MPILKFTSTSQLVTKILEFFTVHVYSPLKVGPFCTVHSLELKDFRFARIFMISLKIYDINGFTLIYF